MGKDKSNVNIDVNVNDEGEVKITFTDEERNRIPRVGDSIYLIKPYPIVTDDMVGDVLNGIKILEEDVREDTPEAYSYDSLMVKATVLSDELDSVKVNGDYDIPINKNGEISKKRKLLVFTNETEARDKFRALMTVSIKEAERRVKLAENVRNYLDEALEKMHH